MFVAFEGNRWHIDQQHGKLIDAIVAAARGNTQARAAVQAALSQPEAKGWHFMDATRRIWAGERNWDALVENLAAGEALLVLRVLEEIEQGRPSSPQPPSPAATGEGGAGAV